MKMSTSTGFQLGSYGYNTIKRTATKEEKHLLSVVRYAQHVFIVCFPKHVPHRNLLVEGVIYPTGFPWGRRGKQGFPDQRGCQGGNSWAFWV